MGTIMLPFTAAFADTDHSLAPSARGGCGKIISWRRALGADAAFLPTAPHIAGVRRFLWAEAVFSANGDL